MSSSTVTLGEVCLQLEDAHETAVDSRLGAQCHAAVLFIVMNLHLERNAWLVICVFCTQGLRRFS